MAYAQATETTPRREDAVSSAMERLEQQVMVLAELCQRAERIADQVDGPKSAGINAATGQSAPPSPARPPFVVGSLAYINACLGDRLDDLSRSLRRIEGALG